MLAYFHFFFASSTLVDVVFCLDRYSMISFIAYTAAASGHDSNFTGMTV